MCLHPYCFKDMGVLFIQYMEDLEALRSVSLPDFIMALQRFGAFGGGRHSRSCLLPICNYQFVLDWPWLSACDDGATIVRKQFTCWHVGCPAWGRDGNGLVCRHGRVTLHDKPTAIAEPTLDQRMKVQTCMWPVYLTAAVAFASSTKLA